MSRLKVVLAVGSDLEVRADQHEQVEPGLDLKKDADKELQAMDFLSTCEAIDKMLRELNFKYRPIISVHYLDNTREQFMERKILISFVGCYNTGKSTLLNSLLKARILPMWKEPETGTEVLIQHNRDASFPAQGTTAATNKKDLPTPQLKYVKQQHVVKEGAKNIYKELKSLNAEVHRGVKGIPKCTLEAYVPFLDGAPPEWQVSLVDTPGFGLFDSHVENLAKEALKSSSVCVYITTYDALHSESNGKYLKFIPNHDQGVFQGSRLIIVVTQFDRVNEHSDPDDDPNDEITDERVKEQTCQIVRKACPEAKISHDDVLLVSGRWAYHARLLAMTPSPDPTHSRCQDDVKKFLCALPNLTRGQGEDLDKLKDDELSEKLEKASGIATLEARIQTMSKSCVSIWVSKMTGDYDRYLAETKDQMEKTREALSKLKTDSDEEKKSTLRYLNAIKVSRKELEDSMTAKKSQVYEEIAAKYPEDLEASRPQKQGKAEAHQLMNEFEQQCHAKVEDENLEFGPHHLETDLEEFLKRAEKELENTFNTSCAFTKIYQVLMKHNGDMRAKVEQMRANARHLCTSGKPNPMTPKTTEASKVEAQEEMPLKGPSLGFLKEKVDIPSVSISKLEKFKNFCRKHFYALWSKLFGSTDGQPEMEDSLKPNDPRNCSRSAKQSESSSYREWNDELEDCMKSLQQYLEEECDTYFTKIKKGPVKYFYDLYCREIRAQLTSFDEEFKGIDKQVTELGNRIDLIDTTIRKLVSMCAHLDKLKDHLHKEGEEYLKNWQVSVDENHV